MHKTSDKLSVIAIIVFVIAFNALFWGGFIATYYGASFAPQMLLAALAIAAAIGWGVPIAYMVWSVLRIAREDGIRAAAKAIGETFIVVGVWVVLGWWVLFYRRHGTWRD